jgi:phosphoribosylformylglycinamidine synthase II
MKYLSEFSKLSDRELKQILKENNIGLTTEEARKIEKILKRTPTLTEAVIWGIQGSEHCSYKSSRKYLAGMPTQAPNVILGPGEDAGIVEIAKGKEDSYGIIVGHESHNHPSQIVPYEGAATGVGGCVRDVMCMGGKILGSMDPLRFGNIKRRESKQIIEGVADGIGGYGNPIGVPNLGGDAYFEEGFNDNCVINVVSFGIVKKSHIIHSYVPKRAGKEGWDIVIVGKPTDQSGMGGASFASGSLEESEKEKNKGAVQEPNPFLKRHLMVSTYDLFRILQNKKLLDKVGFKDMGAGGITCSTVEQVAKTGLGAEIDLGKVNVALQDMPPSVIACAETQERFAWICHPSLTKMILDHYNTKWDLPSVADNAGAFHVGKVTEGNYKLHYRGEVYADAKSKQFTESLQYSRPLKKPAKKLQEPGITPPKDLNRTFLKILSSENVACKKPLYERYDKQVQGYVIIEAGEADAGVLAPLIDEKESLKVRKTGVALSADSNPRQGLIDPYAAAANAVIESMRNVAAVGAYPQAITDCLNYGNPEIETQMWELAEGIRGVTDACRNIKLKNHPKYPTPVISGNVSLYNQSPRGHVPPSAIICCIGKIDDYEKAVTMQIKGAGNKLFLMGPRKDELGGSEYYRINKALGVKVPQPDFKQSQREIYALTDAIEIGLVESAHDISDGGIAVTVAEMTFGGRGEGRTGTDIDLILVPEKGLGEDKKLFSETGGFVVEIAPDKEKEFKNICKKNGLEIFEIGLTTKKANIVFRSGDRVLIDVKVEKAANYWLNGLRKKLS